MSRIMLVLISGILLIVIAVGTLVLLLDDPDYYRPELSARFRSATGMELDIKGAVRWRYWPPIALQLNGIEITPATAAQPLATLSTVDVDLQLLPLLFGSQALSIKRLDVDGLTINAMVDRNGRKNWALPQTSEAALSTTTPQQDAEEWSLDIAGLEFSDITVHYQDESTGADYQLTLPTVWTGRLRYDEPADVRYAARVRDNTTAMEASMTGAGRMSFNAGLNNFTFAELNTRQTIARPGYPDIVLDLLLDGRVNTNEGALSATFKGNLGDSPIQGEAGVLIGDRIGITFDIVLEALHGDRFIATTAADPAVSGTAGAASSDFEVLPLELLNDFDLDGRLQIGSVDVDGYELTNVSAVVVNRDHRQTADISMQGYDGTVSVKFDGTSKGEGSGHALAEVKAIDITRLTQLEALTGALSLTSETTFSGHRQSQILNTLDGVTRFQIQDGTLDVTPVKRVAVLVDTLRGSDAEAATWPDRMPFTQLEGEHRFNKGTRADQTFDFRLENVLVTGSGGFDVVGNHLGYDISIKLEETASGPFPVPPWLARINWPVRCEGGLDDSLADLCLPGKTGIQKLAGDIVKQELRRKGEQTIREKIEERLPDDLKDKASDLLKRLFK
jgi:uncharacterized protein involved in outer membrane biogenesis